MQEQKMNKQKKVLNGNKDGVKAFSLLTIASIVLLVLAHISIVALVAVSYKYYGIYPSLFMGIIAIVVCVLLILDFIFFVGFNYKDVALKITVIVISALMLVSSLGGTYAVAKVNGVVKGILDTNTNKETFSGVFVCYNKVHSYSSLSDIENKRVGMLAETSNGLTYIAKSILDKEVKDYAPVEYSSNAELMQALIDGDVHCAVFTSAYRKIYENDENSQFSSYMEDMVDFYSFEQELKVNSNSSNKDLSKDPFNVLLIGWSRNEIGSTVGLADSIILATINPQTYTVSMMSIARDSFVPIACYGGAMDKINSGRSTSRACFVETVENFLDLDIDFYMEADYGAIVSVVNTVGGIEIDNPVDFELDGVYVPAGKYIADGWQALEFCRERHHMPNGDFDRQQHQKEVILAIAEKFIQEGDVTLALHAMDLASEFIDTDLTLTQLTSVFNLLLNTKNYTGLDTFDLVDFHTLRITGSGGIKYYSYSMNLPLWVYLIYQGSYDESTAHIDEVMGNFSSINQKYSFEFSSQNPYIREPFYSLDYDEKFVYSPDPMPNYWADLSGMTMVEALSWANSKGVTLEVKYISSSSAEYNASLDGKVVDQSIRYGMLCSANPKGTITVMGTGEIDESKYIPNFVGKNYQKVIDWAEKYNISYRITYDENASGEIGKVVEQNFEPYSAISNMDDKFRVTVKAGVSTITFDKNGHGTVTPEAIKVKTGDEAKSLPVMSTVTEKNGDQYHFLGWYTSKTMPETDKVITKTSEVTGNITLYAQWEKICNHEYGEWKITQESTCSAVGSKERICLKCEKKDIAEIEMKEHTFGEPTVIGATCTQEGSKVYTCSVCQHIKTETISALGHAIDSDTCAIGSCSRCGADITEYCGSQNNEEQ